MTRLVAVLLAFTFAGEQSGFRGLEPGRSTSADAERALGAPITPSTGALAEYPSSAGDQRVFITFSASGLVERIALIYAANTDRDSAVRAAGLPSPQATTSAVNDRSRLEEFFGGVNVIFTYAGETAASGVNRITFHDKAFFELATSKATPPVDKPSAPVVKDPAIRQPVVKDPDSVTGREPATRVVGPPPPASGPGQDVIAVNDALGRQLAGTYVVDDADWLSQIEVTWEAGRLRARMPGWTAPLYLQRKSRQTTTGDPDDDVWVFFAGVDTKVLFQFAVSVDRTRPIRVDFVDDRAARLVVESGMKRVR